MSTYRILTRHLEFRENNYTTVKNSRQRNIVRNDCNQTGQKKLSLCMKIKNKMLNFIMYSGLGLFKHK